METDFARLTLDEEEEAVLQVQVDPNTEREEGALRLVGCHSVSFYEAKMALVVDIAEMGWDLSLRVQSRRAQAMNSFWLQEEGGVLGGIDIGGNSQGNSGEKNLLSGQIQTAMDLDLEDDVVIGEEGKKRARGEIEESNNVVTKNRRLSKITHLTLATAKRQADQEQ
ncbi:hypothetical protein CXB51_001222 [Gossypium anomalum]|uniref:Uncharacterized protein n=1 Tax=Gossypium anomalum TaxID=47600 RepID=A0A8J5ZJC1_9ROSI|nr:hypothetical protein CXB51_001222 [Gossypium anomalum]